MNCHAKETRTMRGRKIDVSRSTDPGVPQQEAIVNRGNICPVVPVSIFIFNPFFNHFYHPTCPTVPTLSLCFPMSPYVISMISMFFPTLQTPPLLSLSPSSRPFTRYQEQDLLVVNFGLLRAISTISMIPTILTISLPPPELLYDLS